MAIGLCAYGLPPRELLALGVAADAAGFDTLWLGEHVLVPFGYESTHPTTGAESDEHHLAGPIVAADTELLDPLVALAAIAGASRALRVATGIFILPLRHPLLTARAASSLFELSGGRFVLGVGAGWLQEEFDSLGVPFAERVARFEEAVGVLRAAWAGGPFTLDGTFYPTGRIQVSARPVPVPLVLGGNSPRALRRAARLADGWFSSGTPTFDAAVALTTQLRDLRSEQGQAGDFRCYVRVGRCDRDVIARYHDAGIDDLVVWADQVWPDGPAAARREAMARYADEIGLEPRDT